MISVVIRTKNEERWIAQCLTAVTNQTGAPVEIVVVDNESTDGTVAIARQFQCTIVTLPAPQFSYGRAINVGVAAAHGEYVAILSGHCIPVNDRWLAFLAGAFGDATVAGVYGRQEPMPDSHAFDKRDLWTTFGFERRVQRRDYFFHNANSMVRRTLWERQPFDEAIQGVEDRHWAKQVLALGYTLVYEPWASVYHHHGIHQGRDEHRAARVVRVIETIHGGR